MSNLTRENIKRRPTPEELKIFQKRGFRILRNSMLRVCMILLKLTASFADMTKIGRGQKMVVVKKKPNKFEHLCNFEVVVPIHCQLS